MTVHVCYRYGWSQTGLHTLLLYTCILDIQDLLQEVNGTDMGDDYYPFPSKLFFLLFLLIHSPRPIVCSYQANTSFTDIKTTFSRERVTCSSYGLS